jgi:hypothetical protein
MKLDGVEVRVWNGVTEDGIQVFLFVHRIATHADVKGMLLDRELPVAMEG